jgi:hypothetical protein
MSFTSVTIRRVATLTIYLLGHKKRTSRICARKGVPEIAGASGRSTEGAKCGLRISNGFEMNMDVETHHSKLSHVVTEFHKLI